MSDAPQGPGWWLASDGRWYPPSAMPADPPLVPPEQPAQEVPDPFASPFVPPSHGPFFGRHHARSHTQPRGHFPPPFSPPAQMYGSHYQPTPRDKANVSTVAALAVSVVAIVVFTVFVVILVGFGMRDGWRSSTRKSYSGPASERSGGSSGGSGGGVGSRPSTTTIFSPGGGFNWPDFITVDVGESTVDDFYGDTQVSVGVFLTNTATNQAAYDVTAMLEVLDPRGTVVTTEMLEVPYIPNGATVPAGLTFPVADKAVTSDDIASVRVSLLGLPGYDTGWDGVEFMSPKGVDLDVAGTEIVRGPAYSKIRV